MSSAPANRVDIDAQPVGHVLIPGFSLGVEGMAGAGEGRFWNLIPAEAGTLDFDSLGLHLVFPLTAP